MRVIKNMPPHRNGKGEGNPFFQAPYRPFAYLRLLSFQLVRRTAYERLRIEILRLCSFSCLPSFFSRISSFPELFILVPLHLAYPGGVVISRLAKALDRRLTHLDRPIVNNLILIKLLT